MPVGMPKMIRCKKCRRTIFIVIGDVRPQFITCPYCNYSWIKK